MNFDDESLKQIGGGGGPVFSNSIMRYVAGVVTRERERLARCCDSHGMNDLASAIRDTSMDEKVFKWVGPGADLDVPPKPADEK